MTNQTNEFIQWLDEIETVKGITDYQIAKKGKFSHSVLSRARSGIPPGMAICIKIADVLRISPIVVLRVAGHLPPGGEESTFEDWKYLISQLNPEDDKELRQIAEMKIERRKKEKELKALKPRKVG